MYATAKQTSYILALGSQVAGRSLRYIPEVEPYVSLSKTALRNLTKCDASRVIDELKRKAA